MRNVVAAGLVAVGLVGAAWTFFSGVSPLVGTASEEKIRATAERLVPEPKQKPKPQPKVVIEKVLVNKTVKKPHLVCRGLKCRTQFVEQIVKETVEQPKTVQPTDEEVAIWRKTNLKLQREYIGELEGKISELRDAEADKFREAIKDWLAICASFVGTFVGAGSLYLSVRKDRREESELKEEKRPEDP